MMRLLFLALSLFWFSSCSTYVAEDYPQYLTNNLDVQYPKVNAAASYTMSSETQNHNVKVKSWTTGIANSWYVEFGKILDATLKGMKVQESFKMLKKGQSEDLQFHFNLKKYAFENHMAKISLEITVKNRGKEILQKTYNQNGKSQGGKMVFAGAAGMKNAIQQSTKLAMDDILTEFIKDLNSHLKKPNS